MHNFAYTAGFIAPFGIYTDELILATARNFRAELSAQANAFSGLELRIESDEGVAVLRCAGTDEVLNVKQEVGLYSLHGTMHIIMDVETPDLAEAALEHAIEKIASEKGATILEQPSSMK